MWILVLFLGCYTPGAIVVYILHFCTNFNCEVFHIMRDIGFYLITVNSCMNPLFMLSKLNITDMLSKNYGSVVRQS